MYRQLGRFTTLLNRRIPLCQKEGIALSQTCRKTFAANFCNGYNLQQDQDIVIGHYLNRIESNCLNHINDGNTLEVYQSVVFAVKPNEFEKLPPKCASCGVILQTEYESSAGYVPSKKLDESMKDDVLSRLSCMSCFQLQSYNKPLAKRISNGEVINQLKHLRQQKALILYVVDMFDLEGTMFKNLQQVIGNKKRIILVGNKCDRLPQDNPKASKQLEHMKDILKQTCFEYSLDKDCNFRDICLVSSKSGYGMLSLVEKISKHRDMDMDVYLVGCTNTGKTSLYNLLMNLLNVHKDEILPPQGIVHHLPGSTNSLIRHDISMRRLVRLKDRLKNDPWEFEREWKVDEDLENFITQKEYASLQNLDAKAPVPRMLEDKSKKSVEPFKLEIVDEEYLKRKQKEKKQNYLYDTPGILNETQIVRHFNSSEINYLSPQKWIVPRSFLIKPGGCLFIGGFARFDYHNIHWPKRMIGSEEDASDPVNSALPIYVTLMVSPNVPGHVTITETADEKYEKLFVNGVLGLPEGGQERFDEFPPLKPIKYTTVGQSRNTNCCDVALHGVGWLSISAATEGRVTFSVHTPNGEGQSMRRTPLLPFTVRKKEGRGVAYRGHVNRNMYSSSRQKSPQFTRLFQHQNQPVYEWKAKIREKIKFDRKQIKEEKRIDRLKSGVLLGKFKRLAEKEEQLRLREVEQQALLSENRK
ncbi:uncharacterized protein YqeH-like [Clytia hemisphaerica]|uniref:G domain-containing protein n=1 Tax=Clytia hemisphaerica TaxID=252671 RepID=A0A7M5XKX7_9CNID